MGFKIDSNLSVTNPEEQPKSEYVSKLPEGEYECLITATRFKPEDAKYADAFFIDMEIVSASYAERAPGHSVAWAKFMGPYTKTYRFGDNQTFTPKQQKDSDEKSVQIAFAACLGLTAANAGKVTQADFDAAFPEDGSKAVNSPVVGRRVIVVRRDKHKKDGRVFADVQLRPATGAPVATPAVPTHDPMVAALADGWRANGESGWYYKKGEPQQLRAEALAAKYA